MEGLKRLAEICPPDRQAMQAARDRWDAIAKPLGSLGRLEEAVVRMAGITGSPAVESAPRAVVVMCGDNGVVEEGVTQTGREVTAIVAANMADGNTSVCRMARLAGAEVIPVDIGVARPVPGVLDRNVRRGTANMTQGPAMTRAEAEQALETGIALAGTLRDRGFRLLATGEMGIGNTTAASAAAAVLLGKDPAQVTGRGAGLSGAGLARKVSAIRRAIAVNRPDPKDPVDVLAKVGGLEIAGLAGVFLGGGLYRLPVLVDGFISATAALAAVRLCPNVQGCLLASHVSAEPASAMVLEALGLKPLLCAEMRLGEGTGAVAAMPLLDMALAVYREMPTFAETDITAYRPLK